MTTVDDTDRVRVLASSAPRPQLDIVENGGVAEAIVWPGTGARYRSLHRISLSEGGRTIVLRHRADAVYYVREGYAHVLEDSGTAHPLPTGSMVHIDAGDGYRFVAVTAVEILGGPCPPDPLLYQHLLPNGAATTETSAP